MFWSMSSLLCFAAPLILLYLQFNIYHCCRSGWVQCSTENNGVGSCQYNLNDEGDNIVSYGDPNGDINSAFSYLALNTAKLTRSCDNDQFGDPVRTITKECCKMINPFNVKPSIVGNVVGQISCGDHIQTFLKGGGNTRWWKFVLTTTMASVNYDNHDTADTTLTVYDNNEIMVSAAACPPKSDGYSNDCGYGTSGGERFDITDQTAGTYWIRIAYFDNDGPDDQIYQLQITCSTYTPTKHPTIISTKNPTNPPTTRIPTTSPTKNPTVYPTVGPTKNPTNPPTTTRPTTSPTKNPTIYPTVGPTKNPTTIPTTASPTEYPTKIPTAVPTIVDPTTNPTADPTADPTAVPTKIPTADPTKIPTNHPSVDPTNNPTVNPTFTNNPTSDPSVDPTKGPTKLPTTAVPTGSPVREGGIDDDNQGDDDNDDQGDDKQGNQGNNVKQQDGFFDNINTVIILILCAAILVCCCIWCIMWKKRRDLRKKGRVKEFHAEEIDMTQIANTNTTNTETNKIGEGMAANDTGTVHMQRVSSMSSINSHVLPTNSPISDVQGSFAGGTPYNLYMTPQQSQQQVMMMMNSMGSMPMVPMQLMHGNNDMNMGMNTVENNEYDGMYGKGKGNGVTMGGGNDTIGNEEENDVLDDAMYKKGDGVTAGSNANENVVNGQQDDDEYEYYYEEENDNSSQEQDLYSNPNKETETDQ